MVMRNAEGRPITQRRRLQRGLAALALLIAIATALAFARPAAAQPTIPGFDPIDITQLAAQETPEDPVAEPNATAQLRYSSYLGGASSDYGRAIAVDRQGYIYIAGHTFSNAMLGRTFGNSGSTDVIVLKFSPDGRTLLAGAVVGGTGSDEALDLAITAQGEPVVTVAPGNETFPLHRARLGAQPYGNAGILLKLSADFKSLVFSTHTGFYLSNSTARQGLALDDAGNIYLTGEIYDAYYGARDLIVQKYSPDGQQLLLEKRWDNDSTAEYGAAIALDGNGRMYLTGYVNAFQSTFAVTPDALQAVCGVERAGDTGRSCGDDAFLIILEPNGAVRYASYLGGYAGDHGVDIDLDGQGNIYIVGTTGSADFPTTSGVPLSDCQADPSLGDCYYDIFVTKFAPDGKQVLYSTYLNSNDRNSKDFPAGIDVDAAGNATIAGYTAGESFPVFNPLQGTLNSAPCLDGWESRLCFDVFVATLAPNGAQTFGTYLGAPLDERTYDITLGGDGSIYVTGEAKGPNFPVTANAIQSNLRGGSDMFLTRISGANNGGGNPPPPAGTYRVNLSLIVR